MLDEYSIEQPIAHHIFKNAIIKNKCSHAYLIETNGYTKKEEIAISFAKSLLCPYKYTNNSKCVKCKQCENIDKNIFSELKIIRPDGLWIKKEQLTELQDAFKMKSVQADKKVYIITDATKLNPSSSNSILKFLEEPSDNIIAILLADNIHQLLDTIVSRCQIVTLSKEKNNEINSYLSVKIEEIDRIKEATLKLIKNIENYHKQAILYTKKYHNEIMDRNEMIASFEIMCLYYKDLLNKKLNRNLEIFKDIDEEIIENNTIDIINKKIKIILDLKNKIYINANTNLLIDKLIIELGGIV